MAGRNLPARRNSLPARRPNRAPANEAVGAYLSEDTKRAYTSDILQFFDLQSLAEITMERLLEVTPEDVVAWRDEMMARVKKGEMKVSSVARKLSALRAVYRPLVVRRLVDVNPAHPDLVRMPKQSRIQKTDYLDARQAKKLLKQPDRETPLGLRNYAMLLLALRTGLRRREICGIRDSDFSVRGGHRVLAVSGKGGKERQLKVEERVWDSIVRWVKLRPPGKDYVFVTKMGKKLTEHSFWKLVRKYSRAADLKQIHPHTLRATCIMLLLERGVPIHEIQQMMGHARGETTLGYVRELDLLRGKATEALADLY